MTALPARDQPSNIKPFRRAYRTSWERALGETGSHIESAFLAAFCGLADEYGYEVGTVCDDGQIKIVPQAPIEKYRADFVISFSFHGAGLHLVVECDGHDFHEKTRGQAARDRSRERAFVALGFVVIRFTGREINADARQCADEVLSMVMDFQTRRIEMAMEGVD